MRFFNSSLARSISAGVMLFDLGTTVSGIGIRGVSSSSKSFSSSATTEVPLPSTASSGIDTAAKSAAVSEVVVVVEGSASSTVSTATGASSTGGASTAAGRLPRRLCLRAFAAALFCSL